MNDGGAAAAAAFRSSRRPQLGAIMAYAEHSKPLYRLLAFMLGTAMRPVAALKMDPARQYDPKRRLLDLQPMGAPRTRKRNPVVPVTDELQPILAESAAEGADFVRSRKTAWRTPRPL